MTEGSEVLHHAVGGQIVTGVNRVLEVAILEGYDRKRGILLDPPARGGADRASVQHAAGEAAGHQRGNLSILHIRIVILNLAADALFIAELDKVVDHRLEEAGTGDAARRIADHQADVVTMLLLEQPWRRDWVHSSSAGPLP